MPGQQPKVGDVAINKRDGSRAVWDGQQWVRQGGKPQQQEASMRSRMDIGLGPMVGAHQAMSGIEARENPYSLIQNPGNATAKALSGVGLEIPGMGVDIKPFQGVAKAIGGDDFQAYEQAAATFEAQLMPIMSGAAVSPSEASRQIRSALPELGDSPAQLRRKSEVRMQMLNGAAKARGLPLPYPDVATWGVNTASVPQQKLTPPKGDAAKARRRVYDPKRGVFVNAD